MLRIKKTRLLLTCFLIGLCDQTSAQISGNQVYGNTNYNANYYNQFAQKSSVLMTDSTLTVNVKLLLNKVADSYMITLGLSQDAATVVECNHAINERIEKLQVALSSFNVQSEDLYVDFISQTKIYDYEVIRNEAKQLEIGYEIKKNVLIKFDKIEDFDALIELAAKLEIYDIIKVEYIDAHIDDSYNTLFTAALALIKARKDRYVTACSPKLTGYSRIIGDNFFAVAPKSQYRQYQAFETSSVTNTSYYSSEFIKTETRKHKTFYYDGVALSDIDQVINAEIPKIGIQYVLSLAMVYTLE